jgi:hypothetical protein
VLSALASWLFATPALADTDPSDLWWNAAESGWGMQLVRGGEVTFATLFVYDADVRATFFTATLTQAAGAWSGALYATTGPYFAGASYDAAQVSARVAGTMTFTQITADTGRLQYTVDGATVRKDVTRQTLRFDDYSGSYPLTTQRVMTNCPDSAMNGDRVVAETVAIAHAKSAIDLDWTSAQRTCRYSGAYLQSGKLGAAQTSYACSDGEFGDLAFFELTKRDGVIAGRFQGHAISNGCDYRGRFAGFAPN